MGFRALVQIPNLFISVTENGHHNGQPYLESCQLLDKVIEKEGTARPIAMLTDGHQSWLDALQFKHEKEMPFHVSPPDTASTRQTLDQINASLYSAYDVFQRQFHQ